MIALIKWAIHIVGLLFVTTIAVVFFGELAGAVIGVALVYMTADVDYFNTLECNLNNEETEQ